MVRIVTIMHPPFLASCCVLAAACNIPWARRFLHDVRDGHDTNGREAQAAPPPVEDVRPSAVEAQHWGDYRVDQFGGEHPRRGPQRPQRRAPQKGQPPLPHVLHVRKHGGLAYAECSSLPDPSVPALRAAEETSEAASVGYEYLDPQGVVRGPFPAAKVCADGAIGPHVLR